MGMTDWRAEYERENREYKRAVDALSPTLRAKWSLVLRDNEFFDGENGIALGVLRRMKADGSLGRYKSRYPEY